MSHFPDMFGRGDTCRTFTWRVNRFGEIVITDESGNFAAPSVHELLRQARDAVGWIPAPGQFCDAFDNTMSRYRHVVQLVNAKRKRPYARGFAKAVVHYSHQTVIEWRGGRYVLTGVGLRLDAEMDAKAKARNGGEA